MKAKIVLAAAFALLSALPTLAQVTPVTPGCVKGTLESYIALGAEGCIFDNVLYSNFTYATPVVAGGTATEGNTPANIIVTPILLPTPTLFPGLNFSAVATTATPGAWSVAAGQSEESVIGYLATPTELPATLPASGTLILDLGPSKILGIIGSVTVQETAIPVPPPATITPAVTLSVYEICEDACRIQQTEEVTIAPVEALQTTIVVSLSGGNGGASLSSFASDYAIGPQPE
jgi:hypothetical protein